MVQKRDSGFSAIPLCLHSGCMSGSPVAELLLKFLYNTSAGKSLLEIVYNRFRSFRFFFCRSFRFFSFAGLLSSSCRLCGGPALSSLRLCVRFACGGVATGIPLQHERRKITSGNHIQPISISSPFSPSPILFCVARRAGFFFGSRAARVFFSASRAARVFTCVARRACLFQSCCATGPFFSTILRLPNFS